MRGSADTSVAARGTSASGDGRADKLSSDAKRSEARLRSEAGGGFSVKSRAARSRSPVMPGRYGHRGMARAGGRA
jgi:hypothetical protein